MTPLKVHVSEDASLDIDAMEAREEEDSEETALLLASLRERLLQLSEHPESGRKWRPGYREATLFGRRLTYTLIYRVTSTAVEVVGVVDSRAASKLARLERETRAATKGRQ